MKFHLSIPNPQSPQQLQIVFGFMPARVFAVLVDPMREPQTIPAVAGANAYRNTGSIEYPSQLRARKQGQHRVKAVRAQLRDQFSACTRGVEFDHTLGVRMYAQNLGD